MSDVVTRPDQDQPPRPTTDRLVDLDLVRGVAVLGILLMNIVNFAHGVPGYFNIDVAGSDTAVDRTVGVLGEVFVDQKFMAVFSMLFGAGIVLFHERAIAKGANATRLSLWRNVLLLAIGLLHTLMWDGDVLVVYAICAPFVIAARRWSDRTLIAVGAGVVLLSPVGALLAQTDVGPDGEGLGEYWGVPGDMSDAVGVWLVADFFVRAFGLMLIGIVLYRRGFLSGGWTSAAYRRVVVVGGLIGVALASVGVIWLSLEDFDPSIAVVASIPNTLGTVPAAMAIVAGVILVGRRLAAAGRTDVRSRLEAVGRMALTNYIAQTLIGVVLLGSVLDDLGRLALLGVVVGVWALQLWWSPVWLARFRYGPLEWAWRSATYRSVQPLRR
ncbi:MAG: DUF418 domain-containing protein [Actinomycetota bacterium]